MQKFHATIEFLHGRAAIVELSDSSGGWQGGCRIELRNGGGRQALYELGYLTATRNAALKGGRLEAFKRASLPST
jgi:hypothetical protein